MRTLWAQWRLLIGEVAKFGIVGVFNTLLDFGLFNALHFGAHVGSLISQVIATVVSATTSYFMNRHWTFSHRARTSVHREYLLFFFFNLVGLMIMEACIGVTQYGFGLDTVTALNVAKVVGLDLATLFRFWSYKRWVFLAEDGAAPGGRQQPTDGSDRSGSVPAEPGAGSARLVELGAAQEEPERRRA